MRLIFKALVGIALIGSVSAAQASTVSIIGNDTGLPGSNNNFSDELVAALPNLQFLQEATFTLDQRSRLTFTAVAAESGFNNSFSVPGIIGSLNENSFFGEGTNLLTTGVDSLSGIFNAGILDFLFSNNRGFTAGPGTAEAGVFLDGLLGAHSVFFLAFDDNGAGPDDNHDDFLIRVNVAAVPLPAALPLFGGALGLLGFMGWRRKKAA